MGQERLTIRVLPQLKEQLQEEASRRGDSLNGTIVRLIYAGLKCQTDRAENQPSQPT